LDVPVGHGYFQEGNVGPANRPSADNLDFPMTKPQSSVDPRGRKLLQFGSLLILIGLLVGLAIPYLANPRMGLSSHLEGVMNGMLLILLGLVWDKLALGNRGLTSVYWLSLFSTYADLTATFLAAVWGAGKMMPIAAGTSMGTEFQEALIASLLVSQAISMITVFVLVFVGLSKAQKAD